jgi:enoyl-CoA hydratase
MPLLETSCENGILTLRLNDPARSNLLSQSLCRSLISAVGEAKEDARVKAIVVRANGKAFCAGANLEDLKAAANGDAAAVHDVYNAFLAVADSPLPTVAVVEGAAVGAGMNLALACDMRIVTDAARFDTRFLQIGLHPGGGHAWMLLRAVGWQTASRLLLLGGMVDGKAAASCGLVSDCVDAGELEAALAAMLANLARTPRELLLRTKLSMRLAAGQSHDEAFRHETGQQMWSLQQPAFKELVDRLQRKLAQR